ncbi:MAG: CHC2 zinc finger domain-containing protein, partial [Phycisphaerae bacterium]
MSRIPEPELERLKQQTDLVALVRARGVDLHKHGSKDFAGKCPFHQDDQPSFIVSPEKGLYHCMGCGAAGNAIQFVEKFDGVSFRHAFELLNAGTAAFTAPPVALVKKTTVPRLDSPLDATADDAAIMGQVVDYYHERLLKTPTALDYLRGRGLCHEEAFKQFRLGFSDRTLGLHLPQMNRKDGEAIRTRLQTLGVYRPNGREHLNGCIVLPIFAATGAAPTVGEMYGRRISKTEPNAPKHLFLPGPHAGIWNAEALDAPELILCEAPFDALTFWVNGFRNVTFIYGTEGFTDELFQALLARKVRRIRMAYDADEAGNRAAIRDAERLTAHGIDCFRVKFPWGKDANEYAQRAAAGTLHKHLPPQPPSEALQMVLNGADWMSGRIHHQPEVSTHTPTPAPSLNNLAANLAADEKPADHSASTNPEAPALTRSGDYHLLQLGTREYRIGGLDKNNSLEVLKVAVRLRVGEAFHLDSFDMAQDS